MFPLPESATFRSRFFSALENAKARGAEMLSVAFPRLPENAFQNIVSAPDAEPIFFFENKKRAVAEAAFDFGSGTKFFGGFRFGELENFIPKNRAELSLDGSGVPAPKIFAVGTFSGTAGTLAAIPAWQMSRDAESTRLCAHVFTAGDAPSGETADRLVRGFRRFLEFAERERAAKKAAALPAPEDVREVGGNWYSERGAAEALAEIEAARYRKIVLARAKDFSFAGTEKFPAGVLLAALRERFLDCGCTIFSARVNAERGNEKILGATPETLAALRGGKLETEAVAGTAPPLGSGGNGEIFDVLRTDEKELREHRLVVEFIAEKLRALGVSPRIPAEPQLLALPNVCHLRTPISADGAARLGSIVEALHPTPAMCGLPARAAERFILSHEPFPRENFSAPIGFLDADGNGFFAVAIRCAKISGDGARLRLYAASGLVRGSVPAKEFSEIEAKISAVAALFA